ncbi:hypothetical protein Q7P35_009127 [Cladosporium inversicolor]
MSSLILFRAVAFLFSFPTQASRCALTGTDSTSHTKPSQTTLPEPSQTKEEGEEEEEEEEEEDRPSATMDYEDFIESRLAAIRKPPIPHIDEVMAETTRKRHERELTTPPPPPHPFQTTRPSARALDCASDIANTPELAENILAHLPAHAIASATRVNTTFRNLIQTSPTLQRETFMRPSNTTTTSTHYEVVQWGPGLQQRHLKPLPLTSTASDETFTGLAKERHEAFRPIMVLRRPAVQMALLCPLLEPAESYDMPWGLHFNVHISTIAGIVDRPMYTTARFSEKVSLMPPTTAQPCAQPQQINAHDGGTAAPASTAMSPTTAIITPSPSTSWVHMQLSTPPTHHARIKLSWEGHINGSLRLRLEASHTLHLPISQPSITLHTLLHHASSTLGDVTIETPTESRECFGAGERWGMRWVRENSTLAACMLEAGQMQPGCVYQWSVGAKSEVMIPGVVVPTEGELERLAETEGLSSTPVPTTFHFKEAGADVEGVEDAQDAQDGPEEDDPGADADDEDEGDYDLYDDVSDPDPEHMVE